MDHRILIPLLLVLAACNTETATNEPADAEAATAGKAVDQGLSPGKPSAPVTISYDVLGTPRVGQPVAVEINLSSPTVDRPMRLSYSISDPDSLVLPEDQPKEISLSIPQGEGRASRQVTVVPQREGRVYLNVTAEVETEIGTMLKSMAIPLSVGRGEPEPEVNGELKETAEGETVISMPAEEN